VVVATADFQKTSRKKKFREKLVAVKVAVSSHFVQ